MTPKSLAQVAVRPFGRTITWTLFIAVLAAGSIGYFVSARLNPLLDKSVETLASQSQISGGKLDWRGQPYTLLAENGFLSLAVNVEGNASLGTADFRIEFQRNNLLVGSFAGWLTIPYPEGYTIAFNREIVAPKWGAWKSLLLVYLICDSALLLILTWSLLGLGYGLIARAIATSLGRECSWGTAWKLSLLAQTIGALVLTSCILLYSAHRLSLLALGMAFAFHFAVAIFYVVLPPFWFRKVPIAAPTGENPFAQETSESESTAAQKDNPFSSRAC